MKVSDLMTKQPRYIEADSSVSDALELMLEEDIRHIPVVENGRMIGIVSDRDIRDYSLPLGEEYVQRGDRHAVLSDNIKDIMSTNVISVGPDDDLREAINAMVDAKIGALPVLDQSEGRLLGIVSYIDILRALNDMLSEQQS